MAYAFRCANCNSLTDAGHAGEREKPAKCPTCGAGVTFSTDGIKSYDDDNWVALADLSDKDLAPILKYHAISADDVKAHKPTPAASPDHTPVDISVETTDDAAHEDEAR